MNVQALRSKFRELRFESGMGAAEFEAACVAIMGGRPDSPFVWVQAAHWVVDLPCPECGAPGSRGNICGDCHEAFRHVTGWDV